MKKSILILWLIVIACCKIYSADLTINHYRDNFTFQPNLSFSANDSANFHFYRADLGSFTNTDIIYFQFNGNKYFVSLAGLSRVELSNKQVKQFKLPVDKGNEINEELIYGAVNNYLLFIYDITDQVGAIGRLVFLDKNTYEVKLKVSLGSFNSGMPLIHGNKIYLTGSGWVGKLDLPSGKYDWEINDLYQRRVNSYNSFTQPQLKNGRIFFQEKGGFLKEREPFTLVVNDSDGTVISGLPPKDADPDTMKLKTIIGKPIASEETGTDTLIKIGTDKYKISIYKYNLKDSFVQSAGYGDGKRYIERYFDCAIKLNVTKNGKGFYSKTIKKKDFESLTGADFQKIAILADMYFEGFERKGNLLKFTVSVGKPDTDYLLNIKYQIDLKGNFTFALDDEQSDEEF